MLMITRLLCDSTQEMPFMLILVINMDKIINDISVMLLFRILIIVWITTTRRIFCSKKMYKMTMRKPWIFTPKCSLNVVLILP